MTLLRTSTLAALPLGILLGAFACNGSAIIDDDDAASDDDDSANADDDDAASDDDDAVDDDDAMDDDDAAEDACGPELQLERGTGIVYGGDVTLSGEGDATTWSGCEVEYTIERGELDCVAWYDSRGSLIRINNAGQYVFDVVFTTNESRSTCDDVEDVELDYRVTITDADTAVIEYRWEPGEGWDEFVEGRVLRDGERGIQIEYLSELFE